MKGSKAPVSGGAKGPPVSWTRRLTTFSLLQKSTSHLPSSAAPLSVATLTHFEPHPKNHDQPTLSSPAGRTLDRRINLGGIFHLEARLRWLVDSDTGLHPRCSSPWPRALFPIPLPEVTGESNLGLFSFIAKLAVLLDQAKEDPDRLIDKARSEVWEHADTLLGNFIAKISEGGPV